MKIIIIALLVLVIILLTVLISAKPFNHAKISTLNVPEPNEKTDPTITLKKQEDRISASAFLLDTFCTVTIFDSNPDQYESDLNEVFELLANCEQLFSKTIPESDIYKLNTQKSLTVSELTANLLKKAVHYSELSKGAFDISIGSVTGLWNFHRHPNSPEHEVPAKEAVEEALKSVDYHNIKIDGSDISLQNPDMILDPGAIAKGYIADLMKEYLVEQGVVSGIVNLGGNVLCIGTRDANRGFNIGIQRPFEDGYVVGVGLNADYQSVVTSGIYERYFEKDGVFYHHILDPKTGFPVENDLLSVTIISKDSITGDALSTSCFVLGKEKGMELINQLEDVHAIFLDKSGTLTCSDGFTEDLTIKDISE